MAFFSATITTVFFVPSSQLLRPHLRAFRSLHCGRTAPTSGSQRSGVFGRDCLAAALSYGLLSFRIRQAQAMHSQGSAPTCSLEVEQFPCLSDNFGYLIHDRKTGMTAAVDTPDSEAYLAALKRKGWTLSYIFNTHHHHDHAGGNLALKKATGCKIIGPRGEQDRIPGIDVAVDEGDTVSLGSQTAKVLNVGGHTLGHIAYHFKDASVAFVGDSLFSLGCGRLFEGTYEQMFASLQKLRSLPDETKVYCAHEYTASNARFALSVEPGNPALQQRAREVEELRAKGAPTVPTTIAAEKAANPFLRWDSAEIAASVGASGGGLAVFTETRKRKDRF